MKKKLIPFLLLLPLIGACTSRYPAVSESSASPLSSSVSSTPSSELSSGSSEEKSSAMPSSEISSEEISSSNPSSEEKSSLAPSSELPSSEESSELPSSEESSELPSSEASSELPSSEEETIPESYYYEDFFNPSNEVLLTIRVSNESARKICEYGSPDSPTTQEIYLPMDLTVSVNGIETSYPECGMRIKGNMSRGDSENFFSNNGYINGGGHFKISFNETFEDTPNYTPTHDTAKLKARRFGKAKKLDIKFNRNLDQYYTREAYASYIMEQEGLLAQKINLAKIRFITDSDSKEFIYQVQEVIGEEFLEKRLPKAETKGDLYKCGWLNDKNLSLNDASSYLMGVENKANNQYFVYDLKTNKKKSTHQSLINLINVLTTYDKGQNDDYLKERIQSVVDIDYFLKFAAMEYVIGNPDSMRYNYNNTYLYFNSGNSLLYPIMFDNDRCFGILEGWYALPARWPTTTRDISENRNNNPLYARTVCEANEDYPMVKDYQQQYLNYVQQYAAKYLKDSAYMEFTNSFYHLDNAYSYDNISFSDYASIMIEQINNCLGK